VFRVNGTYQNIWNQVAIVGLAASAALASAEGLIHFDKLDSLGLAQPTPVVAAAAPVRPAAHDAAVNMESDGHYWAEADVDGKPVRFLVDTGATAVALTLNDARRLGLDLDHMNFDQPVRTASGEARAAQVELGYVAVAGARVEKVRALVLDKGLPASLLGMTYLGRLSRFEATRGLLILRS
jgi:aspartyl protease family protein